MLVFPNCKINLGLQVINKRPDGFHTIETVFYPVNWCDALEVIEDTVSQVPFSYSQSGIPVEGDIKQNLVYKAWDIIFQEKKLPALKVHLHKSIPMGAGLGGGSSDAAFFINLLNKKFDLGYTYMDRTRIASQLGSDCTFFINDIPVLAKGKGNDLSEIKTDLQKYYILVIHPNVHSNTKDAYGGIIPQSPKQNLISILTELPVKEWKEFLVNDFEISIFKKYPQIKVLKENLYKSGALYAAMSGSGSAIFGIFDKEPILNFEPAYRSYLQKPSTKIL